jgi:hypothetical protein
LFSVNKSLPNPDTLNLHDTELQSHFQEFDAAQCLGKNIGELAVGSNVLNVHLAFPNLLTNEVKASIDVLTSLVMDWVLAQLNRRHVVHA